MKERDYKVEQMPGNPDRWAIFDSFGNLVDDAQGHGYKSRKAAHVGYAYQKKHFNNKL